MHLCISIHALVKRATLFNRVIVARLAISIHALVKRATRSVCFNVTSALYFNPRPRKEGDVEVKKTFRNRDYISIHALVKRATTVRSVAFSSDIISIHALVKRATSTK